MRQRFIFSALFFTVCLSAQIQIIAHRGASYQAPENTISSVRLAYELGADAAEVDVYLSADNHVMVNHDKRTKRTSGGKTNYKLKKTDAATLNKVDVGQWKNEKYTGEPLPYLRDILYLIPEGKQLVVEIKCGSEIIPALKQVMAESGQLSQCVFISFGWNTICDIQDAFPESKCYYLKMMKYGLNAKMKKAAQKGLSGVNLYYKIIDEKVMKKAKDLKLEMLCWTVDEAPVFDQMVQLGVQGITTNKPSDFVR